MPPRNDTGISAEISFYFILCFILLSALVIYYWKPFDPFVLSERKETFLNPDETYIEDPQIRKQTLVPSNLQSSLPLTLQPYSEQYASSSNTKRRISESFIKSSFNSIWDGSKCSASMLTYCISRGCRFLDFEVYHHMNSQEDKPSLVVAYGGNFRDNRATLKSKDVLSLSEVLKFVMSNAFSSSVCPTATDPLFLHFRVQVNEKHSNYTTNTFTSLLNSIIPNSRKMTTEDFTNRSIAELRNKCGIFVDALTCPWMFQSTDTDFRSAITAFTGTESFPLLKYGEATAAAAAATKADLTPIQENNAYKGGVPIIGVVGIPSRDSLNLLDSVFTSSSTFGTFTMRSLIQQPSLNFLAMPFYENNQSLREYEQYFNGEQSACTTKLAAKAFVEEITTEL